MLFFFLILILLSKGPYSIYGLKRESLSCFVSYIFLFLLNLHIYVMNQCLGVPCTETVFRMNRSTKVIHTSFCFQYPPSFYFLLFLFLSPLYFPYTLPLPLSPSFYSSSLSSRSLFLSLLGTPYDPGSLSLPSFPSRPP